MCQTMNRPRRSLEQKLDSCSFVSIRGSSPNSLIYRLNTLYTRRNPLIYRLITFPRLRNPLIARLCTPLHVNKNIFPTTDGGTRRQYG